MPANKRWCEQCGTPLPDDARFCEMCGTPVVMQPSRAGEIVIGHLPGEIEGKGRLGRSKAINLVITTTRLICIRETSKMRENWVGELARLVEEEGDTVDLQLTGGETLRFVLFDQMGRPAGRFLAQALGPQRVRLASQLAE